MTPIKEIMIVGGGTSGWLTACYLAKTLNSINPAAIQITLVESNSIGILGVGEATFPSIRSMLHAIGLDEKQFIIGAQATYKQGIRFQHWVRPEGTPGAAHYFHPFSAPSTGAARMDLVPHWVMGHAPGGRSFAAATTMQDALATAGHAPKRERDASWQGPLNHAFHFDATLFARVLATHAKTLGVRHIEATMADVVCAEDGDVTAIRTEEGASLQADLFIDCSGMRAELIAKVMKSPWTDRSDVLFVDRAVAVQVPYPSADSPIPSYTISTAQKAGWIWDIGLHTRRGTGYVYSSRHTSDDQAEHDLRGYLKGAGSELATRTLRFTSGYRREPWVGNVVAVGLSGGFLEPLESTGIALIELAAYLIGHLMPRFKSDMALTAKAFNASIAERYEHIIDFLKMHYCLSQRRDSPFWIDNVDPATIPDTLKDRLEAWRHRVPHRLDFVADYEMFLPASWQYVLYGMEYKTHLDPAAYPRTVEAKAEFDAIASAAHAARRDLPMHRDLITQLSRP